MQIREPNNGLLLQDNNKTNMLAHGIFQQEESCPEEPKLLLFPAWLRIVMPGSEHFFT